MILSSNNSCQTISCKYDTKAFLYLSIAQKRTWTSFDSFHHNAIFMVLTFFSALNTMDLHHWNRIVSAYQCDFFRTVYASSHFRNICCYGVNDIVLLISNSLAKFKGMQKRHRNNSLRSLLLKQSGSWLLCTGKYLFCFIACLNTHEEIVSVTMMQRFFFFSLFSGMMGLHARYAWYYMKKKYLFRW